MKRKMIVAAVIILALAMAAALVACQSGERDVTATVIDGVAGGSVDGNTVEIVVEQGTESLDVTNMISTVSNAPWRLYRDNALSNEIEDKVLPGEGYALANGDNRYYIGVESLDGENQETYLLVVHKQYTVTARVLNDAGEQLHSETVLSHTSFEPDYSVSAPTGYRFDGFTATDPAWEADGIIRRDTDFTANIVAKSYSVRYSLKEGESLPAGVAATAYVQYGADYTLAVPETAEEGKYFAGWASAFDDTMMTAADGSSLAPWSRDAYLVVVAVWSDTPPVTEPETGTDESDPETGAEGTEPETGTDVTEPETGTDVTEPETGTDVTEPETGSDSSETEGETI